MTLKNPGERGIKHSKPASNLAKPWQRRQHFPTVFVFLALLLLSVGLSGCRVEVHFDQTPSAQPIHQVQPQPVAQQLVPTITPTLTLVPTATPAPTPPPEGLLLHPTVIQMPRPTSQPPTPTSSIPVLIPAQMPPDRLVISSIGLDTGVSQTTWKVVDQNGMPATVWTVPDNAAGWHQNSALPGHSSNVVLSGHHNMGTEVFKNLVNVQPGDQVVLYADGKPYYYAITDRFILPERNVPDEQRVENARWILPTKDERLTMVTCWPYTDNSHRVIVVAKPVDRAQAQLTAGTR